MHGILTLDPYTFVDLRCFLGDGEKPEGLESVSKIKKKTLHSKKKVFNSLDSFYKCTLLGIS